MGRTHPLSDRWNFSTEGTIDDDRPSTVTSEAEWKKRIFHVIDVSTVEGYWRLFDHLDGVAIIPAGISYYFFRHPIRPVWEDPANQKAGRWYFGLERPLVQTRTARSSFAHKVNQTWLYLTISLIGNCSDPNQLVCGAVATSRPREVRFAIWTRIASQGRLEELAKTLKHDLQYCERMTYRLHRDRKRTGKAFYC